MIFTYEVATDLEDMVKARKTSEYRFESIDSDQRTTFQPI